ncbi:hypothetical protein LINPERHAP1_LOCUS13179 [Linum perenne]
MTKLQLTKFLKKMEDEMKVSQGDISSLVQNVVNLNAKINVLLLVVCGLVVFLAFLCTRLM